MQKGKITEWNDDKGYGFISPNNNKTKVFFHISSLSSKGYRPSINEEVTFDAKKEANGKYKATEVHVKESTSLPSSLKFSIAFLGIASASILLFNGEKLLIPLYFFLSAVTYFQYYKDKKAAMSGKWRVPEATLHTFALLGGWPGAIVAQERLRHKTKKQPFKTILWLTIIINIAMLSWSFTSDGKVLTQKIYHQAMSMMR